MSSPTVRLVGEGFFNWPVPIGSKSNFLGGKCRQCDEVVFPFLQDCPSCFVADSMDHFTLVGRGKLVDFVVVERGPFGYKVPYVQAYVKLVDGPKIYTMLSGVEPIESGPKIGESMEMIIDVIRCEDGIDIVGWKFQPEAI